MVKKAKTEKRSVPKGKTDYNGKDIPSDVPEGRVLMVGEKKGPRHIEIHRSPI